MNLKVGGGGMIEMHNMYPCILKKILVIRDYGEPVHEQWDMYRETRYTPPKSKLFCITIIRGFHPVFDQIRTQMILKAFIFVLILFVSDVLCKR